MNKLSSILFFLLLALPIFADNSITGSVYDAATRQPIDFAQIAVFVNGQTEPIDGTMSDTDGEFILYKNLKNGTYTVMVSFMGYIDQSFTVKLIGQPYKMPRVYMVEDTKALDEVEVVAQGSTMRFELDKKVFTVDQSIQSAGASVTDVLENIPSVEVDQEGTITLRNSEDVEIWINGKPAGLNSDNRADVLKQMPADAIKEIELITNPSAKYSPEGTAGIINLVLNENRKAGYYGSVNASLDYALAEPWNIPPHGRAGFNINWNHGIVDAYFNAGYHYHNANGSTYSDRYSFGTDTTRLIKNGIGSNRGGGGMFLRAGVDIRVAPKHTLGISGFGIVNVPNDPTGTGFSSFSNSPVSYQLYQVTNYLAPQDAANTESLLRSYHRDESGTGSHPGYNAMLSWQYKITDKQNLQVSAQYNNFMFNQTRFYKQYEDSNPSNITTQEQESLSDNKSVELKADYDIKFLESMSVQAGWQTTLSWSDSKSNAWDGTGRVNQLPNYFNDFVSNEQNHALYATYGYTIPDKLSLMIGLRGEMFRRHLASSYYNSPTTITTVTSDTTYFQLYPSVFFNYDFGGGHELQFNYTRRVERPRGHQINPRMDFSDSTNISFGNPSLLPSYSSNIELNYLKVWDRHTLSAGVFWRYREGIVQNIKFMDGETMKNTYINFKTRHEVGLELMAKNKLFGEVLQLSTSVDLYYNGYAGGTYNANIYGQSYSIVMPARKIFAANVRFNAQVLMTKTFSGNIAVNYSSPRVLAQGTTTHRYSIDIGLRKSFLNKQLVLAFNVRDLLNSRARSNISYGDGFWQYQANRWNSRTIGVSLTYNFGNQNRKHGHMDDDHDAADSIDDGGAATTSE